MNGAELVVAALENEGVGEIFGTPGEENLDVVEALRRSKIRLVLTRHEQAAAFMAARMDASPAGRGSAHPLGPGALNVITGAAYALLGAMPMVMITGQKRILPANGGLSGGRHRFGHDAADQDGGSDRQPRDHSDNGAGGVPCRPAGAAWPGSSRIAGRIARKTAPDMSPIRPTRLGRLRPAAPSTGRLSSS